MKLTSKVNGLRPNLNRNEMYLSIEFNIDLELSEDRFYNNKKIYVEFNKDGEISYFPRLGDSAYENHMKCIAIGKAVEEILAFEGDKAKKVYDDAIKIYNSYKVKKDNFCKESNYNELHSRWWSLNLKIKDKLVLLQKTRKEEQKESLRKEIENLKQEKDLLDEKKLRYIERYLNELKLSMLRSISNLEI